MKAWLEKITAIRFDDFPNLPQFIKNTFWLLGDNIVRAGVGFFLVAWMARYLGPEQWGMYSYAYSFTAIFSILGMLGLDPVVIRHLVKEPAAKDKVLGTALLLKLTGTFLSFLLCVIGISYLSRDNKLIQVLVIIMGSGIMFQSLDIIDLYFQSRVQAKYPVWVKNGAFLIISAVKAYLILNAFPLTAFAWLVAFEWFLGAVGLALIYIQQGNDAGRLQFDATVAKDLLKNSWPLLLSGLMGILYLKLDVLMIGHMLSLNELGRYSLAVWLVEAFYFIPVMVMKSSSIKFFEHSDKLHLREILTVMNIITLCVTLSFWLVSPFLGSVFGENYRGSVPYMNLLMINLFLLGLGLPRNPYLVRINKTHIHFLIDCMGVLINFTLNLLLIRLYGINGAVFSKIMTFLFVCVLANLIFKETRGLFSQQMNSLFFIRNLKTS